MPHLAEDEQRWLAVLRREDRDDFLYAVTTTGIVCRPGCPSRRPRRENTRFFATLQQAREAGFRPCQRCRPHTESPAQQLTAKINQARRHLDKQNASLNELAELTGLSPFHLQRTFRATLGVTPAQYARQIRQQRFESELETASVTQATYAAGYNSPSRVYAQNKAMTPSAQKRGGEHHHIRYSITDSPLDRMIVAATDRGICFIAFDESDQILREELQTRFAAAQIEEDNEALAAQVQAVLQHITEPTVAKKLPLHVRATAFQQRVWAALEQIPPGQTRTYAQLAHAIGAPKAVRAVGAACGANPVAPVVPCHRVIGSNGSLTGYRWGQPRKQKLLNLERQP